MMSELVDRLRAFVELDGGDTADVEAAADEIERLRAELEALRKDAERYRWLRNGCDDKGSPATRIAANCYGMEWDAAIDAAMGEKP